MRPANDPGADTRHRTPGPWPFRLRAASLVNAVAWLFLAAMLGFWCLLAAGGDRWWPATLLLYGLRWPLGLPLMALAPLALFISRCALLPVAAACGVLVGPVLGLCVSFPACAPQPGVEIAYSVVECRGRAATVATLADFVPNLRLMSWSCRSATAITTLSGPPDGTSWQMANS